MYARCINYFPDTIQRTEDTDEKNMYYILSLNIDVQ